MLSAVVDMLVRGSYVAWAVVGGLWLVASIVVLAHRRGARPSSLRVLSLLGLTSATAALGLAVATAVSVPRIRWSTEPDATLVLAKGETWRRLRGPAVPVKVAGDPDLAIPTVDAEGLWVLVGLLSGRPVPGLPPAPNTPPVAGSARLCATDAEVCRAWPAAWPDPAQAPRSADLTWSKDGPLSALAFDVESGLYLQSAGALAGEDRTIELVGRLSNDPPRETMSSLFVMRRIAGGAGPDVSAPGGPSLLASGRLQALRVVSHPAEGSHVFRLQRASVSLAAGPLTLRVVARPLLGAAAMGLPLAVLAYLLSPAWLANSLRRRGAVKRALERPLTLAPVPSDSLAMSATSLFTVTEDADLGDALLTRGTVVAVALAGSGGGPLSARAWFEIPGMPVLDVESRSALPETGSAVPHSERGARRKVGVLVPAEGFLYLGAAATWLSHRVRPLAILAAGAALAAPGVVAVASLLGAR